MYLPRQAVELLAYLHKITGHGVYVFPTRYVSGQGAPISDTTINHIFKRLDFGVPEFSPHGTRGTAATLLREHGFDRDVVELLLSSVTTTVTLVVPRLNCVPAGGFCVT